MTKRDFLSAADLSRDELENLLELAQRSRGKRASQVLAGKTLALLFFDRSLRTRVSFEVAAVQLGGHVINVFADRELYDLEPEERIVMDGRAEEHVKDAARTLSRYCDGLGIRHLGHTGSWERDRQEVLLRSYARYASVPVVNLESAVEHPCQAIADAMTMQAQLTRLSGRRLSIVWTNNPEPKNIGPCHSLLRVAGMLGMSITLCHPLGFEPEAEVVASAAKDAQAHGGSLRVVNSLDDGVRDAEVVYTRSWGSPKYWEDQERETIVKRSLQTWIIDEAAMAKTRNAIFMHPLPVRRGVGATDGVLDGPRSLIYDQAENRVHAQKALLTHLLG
ncbi:MAG: N-acetylornithine carbamoyltransferase [Planctomycetes bacterium]|nr:N-acetylornithine carbamoyltransferase [Planctomycetota bacterium]